MVRYTAPGCVTGSCVFIVFWLEPTQLSAELHVALQPCLHFREVPKASSKHSLGKVSTEQTHTVAVRHCENYLCREFLLRSQHSVWDIVCLIVLCNLLLLLLLKAVN